MKAFSALTLFCFLCLAAATQLCADGFIFGGGGSDSGGLWVSTPNARFRNDGPGVVYGLLSTPGGSPTCGYVVVVRGKDWRSVGFNGQATSDGRTASSTMGLEVGGRKLQLVYAVKYDPTSKQSIIETVTLDGKQLDLTKGRVLLVAADGDGSARQCDVDLRRAPAAMPRTLEDVEAQAKALLKALCDESVAVRDFLK